MYTDYKDLAGTTVIKQATAPARFLIVKTRNTALLQAKTLTEYLDETYCDWARWHVYLSHNRARRDLLYITSRQSIWRKLPVIQQRQLDLMTAML